MWVLGMSQHSGPLSMLSDHPASPVLLTSKGPLGATPRSRRRTRWVNAAPKSHDAHTPRRMGIHAHRRSDRTLQSVNTKRRGQPSRAPSQFENRSRRVASPVPLVHCFTAHNPGTYVMAFRSPPKLNSTAPGPRSTCVTRGQGNTYGSILFVCPAPAILRETSEEPSY